MTYKKIVPLLSQLITQSRSYIDGGEKMDLQGFQEYLKRDLEGYIASAVVDCTQGISLADSTDDLDFDLPFALPVYRDTFISAKSAFETVGWDLPKEILMEGSTNTVLLISLKAGAYFQVIVVSSRTPVGMVKAIFQKIKSDIEAALP